MVGLMGWEDERAEWTDRGKAGRWLASEYCTERWLVVDGLMDGVQDVGQGGG